MYEKIACALLVAGMLMLMPTFIVVGLAVGEWVAREWNSCLDGTVHGFIFMIGTCLLLLGILLAVGEKKPEQQTTKEPAMADCTKCNSSDNPIVDGPDWNGDEIQVHRKCAVCGHVQIEYYKPVLVDIDDMEDQ